MEEFASPVQTTYDEFLALYDETADEVVENARAWLAANRC